MWPKTSFDRCSSNSNFIEFQCLNLYCDYSSYPPIELLTHGSILNKGTINCIYNIPNLPLKCAFCKFYEIAPFNVPHRTAAASLTCTRRELINLICYAPHHIRVRSSLYRFVSHLSMTWLLFNQRPNKKWSSGRNCYERNIFFRYLIEFIEYTLQ